MTNPLLPPAENAELTELRSNGAASVSHWKTEADHGGAFATHPTMLVLQNSNGIDWRVIHALIPWFAALAAWAFWVLFLLLPSVFGLHYAGAMPAMNNLNYTLMGLSLCLAATIAAQVQHGVRAIAFSFATLLLAYWF
jgi:hypothetical protein